MRVMALDIGEVRVGVAVSDPGERVASPVCVLPAAEVTSGAKSFRRLLEDWEPELLLCGLPLPWLVRRGRRRRALGRCRPRSELRQDFPSPLPTNA